MIPIKGSAAIIQRDLKPTEKTHTVTVVTNKPLSLAEARLMLSTREHSVDVQPGVSDHSFRVTGRVDDLGRLFQVSAGVTQHGHLGYHGQLMVPPDAHPHVLAVLGMDTHPVAKPHIRTAHSSPAIMAKPLLINKVADAYRFPDRNKYKGNGQGIALIELGGGYQQSDLEVMWNAAGFKPHPYVAAVGVDGATNSPGGDADGEVVLDIQVAGVVAPMAKLLVFFSPNTDAGFYDAIIAAVNDPRVTNISISWGGEEDSWTDQAVRAMESAFVAAVAAKKSVHVAAGDDGSTDGGNGYNVDYPGSSPNVFCMGGTQLVLSNGAISSEIVWNESSHDGGATGGGVSYRFSGRNVPDFSGNAAVGSGYQIYLDGSWQVVGGTSACAPLMAGLYALLGQAKGSPVGFNKTQIDANSAMLFNDVVSGNNSTSHKLPLYPAMSGKDKCTGYGSPRGDQFLRMVLAE